MTNPDRSLQAGVLEEAESDPASPRLIHGQSGALAMCLKRSLRQLTVSCAPPLKNNDEGRSVKKEGGIAEEPMV